jgi:hypothetical protein
MGHDKRTDLDQLTSDKEIKGGKESGSETDGIGSSM